MHWWSPEVIRNVGLLIPSIKQILAVKQLPGLQTNIKMLLDMLVCQFLMLLSDCYHMEALSFIEMIY